MLIESGRLIIRTSDYSRDRAPGGEPLLGEREMAWADSAAKRDLHHRACSMWSECGNGV